MRAQRAILVTAWVSVWLVAAPCSAARVKWWRSNVIVAQLGLTQAQIEGVERTFDDTRPERLRLQHELDDLESALARAIDTGEDATAEALVPRVEAARMAHNIARTVMLIRMYRFLAPEQRAKLKTIRDLVALPPDATSITARPRSPLRAAP